MSAAAVVEPARAEAFPKTLPWTLELVGDAAARFKSLPGFLPGAQSDGAGGRLLAALRAFIRDTSQEPSRFVLCAIDQVVVGPMHVRLFGRCSPLGSWTATNLIGLVLRPESEQFGMKEHLASTRAMVHFNLHEPNKGLRPKPATYFLESRGNVFAGESERDDSAIGPRNSARK